MWWWPPKNIPPIRHSWNSMLHLTDASKNSRWDPNSAEVSLHDDQQDFPFYFESQDGNCLSNVSPIIFLKENVPKFPSFSPLSFSIDFCMLVVLKVLFLSSWQRIVDLNFSPWSHHSRVGRKRKPHLLLLCCCDIDPRKAQRGYLLHPPPQPAATF